MSLNEEIESCKLYTIASYSEQLITACISGDIESCIRAYEKDSFTTNTKHVAEVGLQLAAEHGHGNIVEFLIAKQVNVSANLNWAIRVAAKNGHESIIRTLIAAGADIWNTGVTTYTSRVEPGFEHYYPLSYSVRGTSAFELASQGGHLHILQFIETLGPIHAELWFKCLCVAADHAHTSIIKYITDRKLTDICARDNYALRFSAAKGNLEAVKLLVENGANVNAKSGQAIKWAAEKGRFDVVKYLLKKGSISRIEAFELAAEHAHITIIKYFVDKDIVDDRDSALQFAAASGNVEIAEYLIKKGVSKDAKRDAFEVAMHNEQDRMAEILDATKYRQIRM